MPIDRRSGRRKDSGDIPVKLFAAAIDATVGIISRTIDGIAVNPRPPVVDLFDLADAVRYFVKADRGDPAIVAGALLVRPHAQGHLLHHVFLDRQGRLCADGNGQPFGRRVVARRIGDELADRLVEGNDFVIFN